MSLSILLDGQADYFRRKGYTYYTASGPCDHDIDDKFYTEIPLVRRPNIYKDLKALWSTCLWLHKLKPDIIHTHTPKAGLIGMIAGYLTRVPVRLHTVAGIPWMESKGILRYGYRILERLTYFFATKVYPNSYGLHKFLIQEIPTASHKYKVLGNGSSNGIDLEFFSNDSVLESKEMLRSNFNLDKDGFIWLFVGRIVKDKGINELIEAFIQMDTSHSLLMVGPFEDEHDPISEKARAIINSHSKIFYFGFQKDIRPFIKASDVLLFPSYREGFPNVPLQAASMGLPQIVSNINGCNEIVIPNETGIIVAPKNVSSLCEAMKFIASNHDLRKSMGCKSRDYIKKTYSRQEMWKLIEHEYNYHYSIRLKSNSQT
jgi:glycosyltransferase involved in cell wall biosynthesis